MSKNSSHPPDRQPEEVRPFSGSPAQPETVGQFIGDLRTQFGADAAIIREIEKEMRKIPFNLDELSVEHFRQLTAKRALIVKHTLQRAGSKAKQQSLISEVLYFAAECAGAACDEHYSDSRLIDVVRALPKILGFGLRQGEENLLAKLSDLNPQRFNEAAWEYRDQLLALARRLHLEGLISSRVVPPKEVALDLQCSLDGTEKIDIFAKGLRAARNGTGMTQRAAASAIGITYQEYHHWEKGKQPPGPSRRPQVEMAARIFKAPDLEHSYEVARALWGRTHPHGEFKRLRYKEAFSEQTDAQFKDWIKWESERRGVMRAGKKNSSGPLAPNSVRCYYQLLGRVLHYMQAPRRGIAPEYRGVGLPKSETDICGLLIYWEAAMKKLWARQGREWAAQADFGAVSKLRDLFSEDGYIFQNAETLAQTMPPQLRAKMPHDLPAKGPYQAQRCRCDADRLRAACMKAVDKLEKYVDAARGGHLSRHRFSCLQVLLSRYWHIRDGVTTLICRIPRRIPRTIEEAEEMMGMALLGLELVHPPRPSSFAQMKMADYRTTPSVAASEVRFHAVKNKRSRRAEETRGDYRNIPGFLGERLRDYIDFARPMLVANPADTRLFPPGRGRNLKTSMVGALYNRLAKRYAPDLFPEGLPARAMRCIAATDCVTRFDIRGEHMAADQLGDHVGTTTHVYVCRAYVADRGQSGEATIEAIIAASFQAITGHKFEASALLPGETLRYPLKPEFVSPEPKRAS